MDEVTVWWGVDFGRGIHWQIPFKALDGTSYQVNIYEEGYDGNVVVLKGGAQPFVTEETDDSDAFLPIRSSSGYISVICENAELVNQILPVNVHDRYVELYNATAQKTVWNGYILPSEFSGEWNVTPYELQLPVASPVAACQDLKYEGFMKAVTIGDALKKILYDQMKVAPSFIMSGKFPAQTASFLTAIFSDIQFAEVDSSPLSPAYGSGQNVEFGDEYTTIGEVLEAICKLYGYVLHETPDALWFCSSDMSTDYYQTEINYDPNDDYLQNETTIALSDVDMPDIAASYNERSLLPGKSKVRVYCEAEEVGDMLSEDFDELVPIESSYFSNRTDVETNVDGFHAYIRSNGHLTGFETFQYVVDEPDSPIHWDTNMFKANMDLERRAVYGANFLSYVRWKRPDTVYRDEFDRYKNVIIIGAGWERDICVRLHSKKIYSALNFTQNGLIFTSNASGGKEWDDMDFKWGIYQNLKVRLRWGDYYYVPFHDPHDLEPRTYNIGTWEKNPEQDFFYLQFRNPDGVDHEGIGKLVAVTSSSAYGGGDRRAKRMVIVPPDNALDINGPLELEIYNWFSGAQQEDLKYFVLNELLLSSTGFSEQFLGDNTDHYLSDFRRNLSNSKAEEYEYEMVLNNMMASYSPSGVVPPATVQDTPADYFEQTILDRLSNWYDRTIEQLTVTVEYSNLSPGQRIERDNSLYIVVSRADNWRDSNVTLTLQKMYEPQATN